MEHTKNEIIRIFESKNKNFKKGLSREFNKETTIVNPQTYKYREILIYDLFKEITEKNDSFFDDIENPLNFIEETLFSYVLSKTEN
jgi:hypothetical protein